MHAWDFQPDTDQLFAAQLQQRLLVSIAAKMHRCTDPLLIRELAEQVAAGQLTRKDVTSRVRQATPVAATKPQRLSLSLATGIMLQLPASLSLAECEAADSKWLRLLRQAKSTMSDVSYLRNHSAQ